MYYFNAYSESIFKMSYERDITFFVIEDIERKFIISHLMFMIV